MFAIVTFIEEGGYTGQFGGVRVVATMTEAAAYVKGQIDARDRNDEWFALRIFNADGTPADLPPVS